MSAKSGSKITGGKTINIVVFLLPGHQFASDCVQANGKKIGNVLKRMKKKNLQDL